nr:Chain A, Spike protein S2' [Severe acute respiratory syndrome coronavirus 2]
DVVNQNG